MSSVNNQLTALFESNEYIGHRKVIISSAGTSNRNNLRQYLRSSDVLYAEVLPNPNLNQLIDFFRIIQLTEKDLVFAIGGGSVIDFAKLVALFAETPSAEIKGIIESARFGLIQKALKLIIVPTLFGSGAEQTPFAVCYIGKRKYSVANDLILPTRVEYIPEINISAPSNTKLANVLDCFCQAAESLTARNSDQRSKHFAEEALYLLVAHGEKYITDKDLNSASEIAAASELCGKAIAISKTTGPHAMSYFLTSQLGWDHGVAVAMSFLFFMDNYKKQQSETLEDLNRVLMLILGDLEPRNYFELLGLDVKALSQEILAKNDIKLWLDSVNVERLSNGPDIDLNWLNHEKLKHFYIGLT